MVPAVFTFSFVGSGSGFIIGSIGYSSDIIPHVCFQYTTASGDSYNDTRSVRIPLPKATPLHIHNSLDSFFSGPHYCMPILFYRLARSGGGGSIEDTSASCTALLCSLVFLTAQ